MLRPPAHLITHPYKVAWLSTHPEYDSTVQHDPAGRRLALADQTALIAAERVFATSAAAAARWERRTGVSATVLRPPAPTNMSGARARHEGSFRAVYLGQIVSSARLIELSAALRSVGPTVSVHLCGSVVDPILADELSLLAARLRPGVLTMTKRRVDAPELAGIIANADALICLSQDDDAALAAIDRAAAEHRPIIVSQDCAAAVEYISAPQTGIAVAANDPFSIAAALNDLAADPEWARTMGNAAAGALTVRPNWDEVLQELLLA